MELTLNIALYFTIIGLSFAAPNARHVRWCTISDLEQQKCNDLMGSCNVPDINLVCVQKASTDNCMAAIRDGEADAIFLDSGDVYTASRDPYNLKPIIAAAHRSYRALTKCMMERQKALESKLIGRFVPQCDEKGNYQPQQCHGSTGHCWCVTASGEKIEGTNTLPGQTPPKCETHVLTKCLKERRKLIEKKMIGAFTPQCDEKGNYQPQQCHASTRHCWCVNPIGERIEGTNTPPGETRPTCEQYESTKCWNQRQEALYLKLIGNFIPLCDGKGNYHPMQCHGRTGYCWCVNQHGETIEGTNTPPGETPPTCEQHGSDKCHYAVAVVKKSSTFQFDQLQGKRSCHSGVSKIDGWIAPINVLVENKLLSRDGPPKESIEKAVSKFFSDSCIPGASESNLCHQCKGDGEKKCRCSHDEPYYGDHGALRCLKEGNGDVAFLKSSALSEAHSGDYELLCPDNTRKPLNKYQQCHLGKVPGQAVVTREAGDKTEDIDYFLLEAQKKQCTLFSSQHGKDLMFHDSTTQLALLPSEVDIFFFLGVKWYNTMNALSGDLQLPSKNKVRWCTINKAESMKCKDWSDVSGGAIACTEASSPENCIKLILKGEADAVALDVQYMYEALKCGLMPAVEEYHNKDDFGPCRTRGSEIKDFGTKNAVALVKKNNKDINWNNLKGKKSCHTGVGHIAGWVLPFSLISQQNDNCGIGSFFAESCAPGSDINSNLCKLCIGDPENPMAKTKCSFSDKEAYYGDEGAMRCLVETGDVAFISHTAVFANMDGKNPAEWAKNLKSEDFELLCLDGSRAPIENYKTCKLSGIPPRAIVTREESVSDVVRIVSNQQSLYGHKGFEKDMFQLFSSNKGQNLLFSDATQCLIEFDRQPKDIMEDYFGKSYYTAVHSISKCSKPSELVSACTLNHC